MIHATNALRQLPPSAPILLKALDLCDDALVICWADGQASWTNAAFTRLAAAEHLEPTELIARLAGAAISTGSSTGSNSGEVARDLPFEDPLFGGLSVRVCEFATEDGQAMLLTIKPPHLDHRAGEAETTRDVVTDLPDRRSLERELRQRFADPGHPFAVLFVDLDGFKQVNDTLGHLAGDRTLAEVARRFRDALRDHDLLARYGGDEFVVLADGVKNHDEAAPIVARLELAMAAPIPDAGANRVSASVGVALSVDDHASPEALLHAADRQMYARKRAAD